MIDVTAGHGDARLVSLFEAWRDYRSVLDADPHMPDADFGAILDSVGEAEAEMAATRADTATGVQVKLTVVRHYISPAERELSLPDGVRDLLDSAMRDLGRPL